MQRNFIFGGNTEMTYDDIQRKRRIADAIAGSLGTPRSVGEGLSALGKALAVRGMNKRADAANAKNKEAFEEKWASLFGGGMPTASTSGAYTPPKPQAAGYDAMKANGGPTVAAADAMDAESIAGDTMVALGKKPADPWAGKEEIKAGIFAGESGGDYDALFGYQNRPGGKFANVKPTEMTVGEIAQFTDPSGQYGQWVKGQVGRVATPVGAYQVVGTTLRDAVANGVVSPDEKFTPEVQDRVGAWVLSTQGTGAWEGYKGPRAPGSVAPSGGGAPSMGGMANVDIGTLAEVAGSPYASAGQRAIANALIQQRMQASDPMRAMEMERARLELDRLRNPKPETQWVDGVGLIDKRTGEVIRSSDVKDPTEIKEINGVDHMWDGNKWVPFAGGGVDKPDVKGESDLRKEYTGQKNVKDFKAQAEAFGRIRQAAQNPTGVGDVALIISYMKLLDPGSVVREGEFATAEQTGGVPAQVRNLYNKLLTGERLTPEQRQDFIDRAQMLYKDAEQQHMDVTNQYVDTADQYGYNVDRTIPDYRYQTGEVTRPQARPIPPMPDGSPFPDVTQMNAVQIDDLMQQMKTRDPYYWDKNPQQKQALIERLRAIKERGNG